MLSGCAKALNNLPTIVLKEVLLPIIDKVWNPLCNILKLL